MISVGLPLYEMNDIAWLAVESLCNQVDAPQFELLVIEEKSNAIGKDYIESMMPKLQKANCIDFKYISLDNWVPLGNKWVELVKVAKGEQFILQSGDCYSQPYRLAETYSYRNYDWVQSNYGLFYDIETQKTILYNRDLYSHPCGLNMAFKTALAKERLINEDKRIFVDSWLYGKINPNRVAINNSDNWLLGLDTNGRNKLSKRSGYFSTPKAPFEETTLKPCIPIDLFNKLNN